MNEKISVKVKVVHEETAEAFERALNAALKGVKSPKIEFNTSAGHCAYITFEEVQSVPETAEDEYFEKMGERCHCGDCPHLERSTDKRVKWHTCKYSEFPVKTTSNACELYYRRLLKGEF